MQRRGFLKLAGAAATAALATRALPSGVLVFDEPLVEVCEQKDWIIDRGDYYLVMIPSEKILRGERFDKPVLAVFGMRSVMEKCDIRGFMNIAASDQWVFMDSQVDASGYASTTGDRPAIHICDGVTGGLLEGLYITGAVKFDGTDRYDLPALQPRLDVGIAYRDGGVVSNSDAS